MFLTQLDICRVRNLKTVSLTPSPDINLIHGENASGKTSLLEAIYLLSHARSFRSSQISNIIQRDGKDLRVVGKVHNELTGQNSVVGIQKQQKQTLIRINQESISQASRLAAYLPVQLITPEVHQLIEQGPSQRRKFIDWGLFHVEQDFHSNWVRYTRVLKQRNAAIRNHQPADAVTLWNKALLEEGMTLTQKRSNYVATVEETVREFARYLLDEDIVLEYRPGWPKDTDFATALEAGLDQDMKQGYTRYGPHRADLVILNQHQAVKDLFSRGQQKLLVCSLLLAQISHLNRSLGQKALVLIDDLAAELDQYHRNRLLALLSKTGAQIFITATEKSLVPVEQWDSSKLFHVEHGTVHEVI